MPIDNFSVKPVLGNNTPSHQIPVNIHNRHKPKEWFFSFMYFQQHDFFGLGGEKNNWFISLFERLQDICKHSPEEFSSNNSLKDAYRYHEINWRSKNIPIKRSDLTWVNKDIISNEVDFPFYQFHISKGNGRVVGFWGLNQVVFYIVLLDPKHNIQPAGGKYGFRVDKTFSVPCQYTSLLNEIDRLKSVRCGDDDCKVRSELQIIQERTSVGNFVYFQLDDDYYQEFKSKTKNKSMRELIELWILNDQ